MNILGDQAMPFRGQVVPAAISIESIDEALELLGFGDDSDRITSFSYEGVDEDDAYDAATPNLVGLITVSLHERGVQFTATIPVVDLDD